MFKSETTIVLFDNSKALISHFCQYLNASRFIFCPNITLRYEEILCHNKTFEIAANWLLKISKIGSFSHSRPAYSTQSKMWPQSGCDQ